jgi:hypothetical protein
VDQDLGPPIAYLALEDGMPVYASDGEEVGKLTHVLADPDDDIFDGIVIDTRPGPGGHRFADVSQIAELHEGGIVLGLDSEAAKSLPEPAEAPGALEVGPDDVVPDRLDDKLRRAWRRISGTE